MVETLRVHPYPLRDGIRPTPEFAGRNWLSSRPTLASVRACCTYCSSGALLRCHVGFKQAGESPFKHGYCIVDPDIPEKVARDASRRRKRGMVQLCTTVDAWCPGAQQYDLGRRCLKAILDQPGWTVRILTKNAAVVRDFDLLLEHRDRVVVGLSLTRTAACERVLSRSSLARLPAPSEWRPFGWPTSLDCASTGCSARCCRESRIPVGCLLAKRQREEAGGARLASKNLLKKPLRGVVLLCLDEPFCSRLWSKIQNGPGRRPWRPGRSSAKARRILTACRPVETDQGDVKTVPFWVSFSQMAALILPSRIHGPAGLRLLLGHGMPSFLD